jgi:hypothetical protein
LKMRGGEGEQAVDVVCQMIMKECLQGGATGLYLAADRGNSDVAEVMLEKGGGADLAKIKSEVSVYMDVFGRRGIVSVDEAKRSEIKT